MKFNSSHPRDGQITSIREYAEEMPVRISVSAESGRLVIEADNEAGHNGTEVDLVDVLDWVRANRPDLLHSPVIISKGNRHTVRCLCGAMPPDGVEADAWVAAHVAEAGGK